MISRELHKLAFEVAEKNKIPHKFDSQSGFAG